MQTTETVPAGLPPTQTRPSSMSQADVYGSHATGIPTTIVAGTAGGARIAAATTELDAQAPITVNGIGPDFLQRPAGLLLVALGLMAALSYFDR